MCKSCGSNSAPLRSLDTLEINREVTMQNLFDSGKYKLVRYVGRQYTATVGSPTGIIIGDNLRNYGRGKDGDYLLVHVKDIEAAPTLFTVLAKNTQQYQDALEKYGLKEKGTMAKEITSVAAKHAIEKAENAVTEPNLTDKKVSAVEVNESNTPTVEKVAPEDVTVNKILNAETVEPDKDSVNDGGKLLSKNEAIPLKDFQDRYGFTHQFQVLAKVKSGELKSFKNDDDDGKTYIYHYEE